MSAFRLFGDAACGFGDFFRSWWDFVDVPAPGRRPKGLGPLPGGILATLASSRASRLISIPRPGFVTEYGLCRSRMRRRAL